jgi:hypothetical protein
MKLLDVAKTTLKKISPSSSPRNSFKNDSNQDILSFLTLNVLFNNDMERYKFLLDHVCSTDVDIICFQEVTLAGFWQLVLKNKKLIENYDMMVSF